MISMVVYLLVCSMIAMVPAEISSVADLLVLEQPSSRIFAGPGRLGREKRRGFSGSMHDSLISLFRSLPLCLLHHANAHAHQATRRRENLFRAPLLASSLLVVRPTSIVMHGDLPMPMPVMITSTRTSQQEYPSER
jgi:hypothetical protein